MTVGILSFLFFMKYGAASAPVRAGVTLLNAGARAGPVMTGTSSLPRKSIPKNRMTVVTTEDAPMARVVITSPSSVPRSTLFTRSALVAEGSFIFMIFPVMKER